jgi:PAS domain S-box-containing protein
MVDYSFLNNVVQNSTFGYTYNKIILDDAGVPCDYSFLDVNAAYETMIGLPKEQIIGKKVSEVLPDLADDSFGWIECFGKVALTGEKTEFEAFSRSVGRWFHISVSSPAFMYFVGISFDITDKKEMEMQLARSEELNRRYVENAPDGILIIDELGRYLKANIAACRMLGYTERELRGRHISEIAAPGSADKVIDTFSNLKRNGQIRTLREMCRKDGSLVITELNAVALQDNQYMAFVKDITSSMKLQNEKEQYFNVFSSINQPILITNPEGRITAVNEAFTEMYGYSYEELLGSTPKMFTPDLGGLHRKVGYEEIMAHARNQDLFEEIWACAANPALRKWEGVIVNRKKDGSVIWVDFLVNGAFDADEKLTSILCFPIDVTEKREIESENRIRLYRTIADLAELRDDETGMHMKRVGMFARLMAAEFGMPQAFCENIELFAPMHDIGKVGILDSILRAPRKLTQKEFEVMKTHTVLGHNIVKGKPELEMAAEITLCHHERFDGTGYPNGIAGNRIPLAAQITALCDVYDALRSARPYKAPWTHEAAVSCIAEGSGSQFGREIVDNFLKVGQSFQEVYASCMDLPINANG